MHNNTMKKDQFSLQSNESFSASIMNFYRLTSFVFVPAMIVYFLLFAFGRMELGVFELIKATIAVLIGIYALSFYRFQWAQNTFVYFHFAVLLVMTFLHSWWFENHPDEQSTIRLLLTVFLVGTVLIQSTITIIYFIAVIVLMTIVTIAKDPGYLIYPFYVLFTGIIIVFFTLWREKLVKKISLVKDSYKNLFSDSSELIFVLDENIKILEVNKAAMEYLQQRTDKNVIGRAFNDVFCSKIDTESGKFSIAIGEAQKGKKSQFEANCSLIDSSELTPKEFTVRSSTYFNKDVIIITIRLIQDQRDYEQKLIESKENISKVLDNINSFIYNITFNLKGDHQINYVSTKVSEVYGIEADEYITRIKSGRLNEIFYHEDRPEIGQLFDEVIRTGEKNRFRFRIVRNGEIRWIEEKIFPKKNESTGTVFLFGIVTDITDQIESLQTIEASEKRYRQIFERNMAGVYKTHVDGTVLEANPAFAKILGYQSQHELIGQNIKGLYTEKTDRNSYIDRLRKVGSINNYISHLRRKDGQILTLNNNVSIQPDDNGDLNIIEGTLIDITELEDTANALKTSEEKYRLLFEEANTGILLLSTEKNDSFIIDLNRVSLQLFGYDNAQLVGLKLSDVAVNGNELQKKISTLIEVGHEKEKLELEWNFKRKNGNNFYAEVSFIPIVFGREKIVQAIVKDISERKKNEKELLDSQRSFKNIVDNSPAAILIFTDNKLVYLNPSGERLYNSLLNNKSTNLKEVFPDNIKFILGDLINEKSEESNSYTEVELGDAVNSKKYSLSVVKTVYNNEKSNLFLMQDITLQTEYNTQKLRAELAEETNKNLQEEIIKHRQTQAELLEKTFWLNALFESSYNLFILSLDKNFRLSSFNENFKRMIKKKLDIDVKIGDNFMDLFDSDNEARSKIEERFKRVLDGQTLEFVSHFTSKTGEVWVESFLNPVNMLHGDVVEISFISHEITDKIEAQRKSKISEANNRAILLAMPDILYKVNKDGFFTDYRINLPRGLDQLDGFLATRDIVGKHVSSVFVDNAVAEKFMDDINEALDKNELVTDTIEFRRDGDVSQKVIYYENRFSKMNEDEVIVLSRNITETIEYEARLLESVKEKEVLLKEVHHRVKNNLQVINSILNLQSSYVTDPKTLEIINESQNRIRSMSYIHESLYQTKDFSSINFADYITNLVQNLVHSYQLYENKINLDLNIEPVNLALDQAIPCGLILNELISNSLKYAYPDEKKGTIAIHVHEENKRIHMRVEDFGIGLPVDFKLENSESLGLSLVYTLVDQLDGELILKTSGGTKFLITFDKQNF